MASGRLASLRAQRPPTEYEVKAAYLYQFGKFVQWPDGAPASARDSFDICVLGKDPFGSTLDETVSGRSVQGKKVAARRLETAREAENCNILFISSSEEKQLGEVLKAIHGKGVLTVSEMDSFLARGGMISFEMEQRKVRFEINVPALERANLKVSSQLLKVAKLIRE